MKKSDLYREWARVLDMCEGTGVDPRDCWKYSGMSVKELPRLDGMDLHKYAFAVAILEKKPVFVGDKLYGKYSNTFYTVSKEMIDRGEHDYSDDNYWSWNPPKSTFNLNGEELPCPDKRSRYELRVVGFNDNVYHFANGTDIRQVECAINRLLQDATK